MILNDFWNLFDLKYKIQTLKQAIQSIISNNLLPDLDLLRDRDRRGGGLRDRLGERDRDRPTKIQNKCLLQYYGKKTYRFQFPNHHGQQTSR